MRDGWSEERASRLRRLWVDGKSSGEIAEMLGVSRSSVMGKVGRMGLVRRVNGHDHRGRKRIVCDLDCEDFERIKAANFLGCNSMAERIRTLIVWGLMALDEVEESQAKDLQQSEVSHA